MKRDELLSTYLARLILLFYGVVSIWSVESMYAYNFFLASSLAVSAFFIGLCPLKLCNSGRFKTMYIFACLFGILVSILMAIRYEYDDYTDILFIALVLSVIASISIMLLMKIKYREKQEIGNVGDIIE